MEATLANEPIAAIAVSRPTNPTGNVLTDEEIQRLADLAERHGIPLIIDNAYGAPFPGVIFTDAKPYWEPHVIMTLSLSKLGLPGTRTAVVIGPEQIASAIAGVTAIAGLANGNIGQQLVLPLIESGEILKLGPEHLRPFYAEKSRQAEAWIREFFTAQSVDWALHVSEGAFFHWLWLRGMNISTQELYRRLKARNVLIVPGEYFFFGLREDWPHSHQCLRLNFSQPADIVREGLRIIADEAAKLPQSRRSSLAILTLRNVADTSAALPVFQENPLQLLFLANSPASIFPWFSNCRWNSGSRVAKIKITSFLLFGQPAANRRKEGIHTHV